MELLKSRLEINALLENLTFCWDKEIAAEIVRIFHRLPFSGKVQLSFGHKKPSRPFSGFTQEHGDVTIKDNDKLKVKTFGENEEDFERVGNFKIKKKRRGRVASGILFFPFAQSDIATQSFNESRIEYEIDFINSTLEPFAFFKIYYEPKERALFGGLSVITFSRQIERIFYEKPIYFIEEKNWAGPGFSLRKIILDAIVGIFFVFLIGPFLGLAFWPRYPFFILWMLMCLAVRLYFKKNKPPTS
ncbi:MAG: hypothetical protein Q8Q06_02255 [bacterium]|nr:hypothetical protein [bacterium]